MNNHLEKYCECAQTGHPHFTFCFMPTFLLLLPSRLRPNACSALPLWWNSHPTTTRERLGKYLLSPMTGVRKMTEKLSPKSDSIAILIMSQLQ